MADLRLNITPGSIRNVALTSPAVRAVVAQRAEAMARAAQSRTDDPIEVEHAGRSRARSYVRRLGSGTLGESRDRALGSSMDAGR